MKSILLALIMLLATSIFGQDMTNGSFVVISGNPTYELVGKGKTANTNNFVNGHSYVVAKESYYMGTNNEYTVLFSHGLTGKIENGSQFSVISFLQEIPNVNEPPAVLKKGGASIFSATMMKGDAYFTFGGNNELSSCVISTPLVDIELQKGKFYFHIEEDGIMVFVLEGKAIAHGERGKKEEVEAGRVIVAAPIRFQMKGFNDKVFLNSKKAKLEELTEAFGEILVLEKAAADFIFAVIDGKAVAIKVN